jgi:hypothetical protein
MYQHFTSAFVSSFNKCYPVRRQTNIHTIVNLIAIVANSFLFVSLFGLAVINDWQWLIQLIKYWRVKVKKWKNGRKRIDTFKTRIRIARTHETADLVGLLFGRHLARHFITQKKTLIIHQSAVLWVSERCKRRYNFFRRLFLAVLLSSLYQLAETIFWAH